MHRFAELGMTADEMVPEKLDAFISSETLKWTRVINDAHIQALE
jgi:hypothetical protein